MKLVGERRAIAAIILAFYFIMYLANALLAGGPLAPALYALAGVYGLAAFSLISGYFWARWYAVGVSLFGVIVGAVGLWQVGFDEQVVFIGGTHLVATMLLWGSAMSQSYDGQTAWRERFHMDDNAVQRLGKAVIRAGVSLPFVLLYALAPKAGATGDAAFDAFGALGNGALLALGGALAVLAVAPYARRAIRA